MCTFLVKAEIIRKFKKNKKGQNGNGDLADHHRGLVENGQKEIRFKVQTSKRQKPYIKAKYMYKTLWTHDHKTRLHANPINNNKLMIMLDIVKK